MSNSFTGFVGLGTGTTTFVEQAGTGYARQSLILTPNTNNTRLTNSGAATFTASGNWSNASTQIGVFATAASANPLFWWNKIAPVAALPNGSSFTIPASSMNLFLADNACAAGTQTLWQAGDVIGTTSGGSAINVGASLSVNDGVLSVGFPSGCIGHLIGANMNVTTDQQLTLNPLFSGNFIITKIITTNASESLTTAAGGIYPAASKGGTAIVASSQAYSALTSSALYTSLTLATTTNTAVYSSAPYLSLTTAQGSAATADLYAYGYVIG